MNSGRSFAFHKFLYLQIVIPNEYNQMSSCPNSHEIFLIEMMEQVILS